MLGTWRVIVRWYLKFGRAAMPTLGRPARGRGRGRGRYASRRHAPPPSTWIAALAAVVFLALGVRALLAPADAAAFFGVPVHDHDGLAFVRVFGARNIGLSLVALALLALDMRMGLAAVFLATALIASLDFSVVALHAGMPAAPDAGGRSSRPSSPGHWIPLDAQVRSAELTSVT